MVDFLLVEYENVHTKSVQYENDNIPFLYGDTSVTTVPLFDYVSLPSFTKGLEPKIYIIHQEISIVFKS